MKERVAAAITGFALGGVGGAVAGGAGGLRGAAASAVGAFSTAFLLAAAGVTAAPVVIPIVIAASIAGGAAGGGFHLEERIKRKTASEMDERLRDLPGVLLPKLITQLRQSYQAMEDITTDEITALITEEVGQIQKLVQENQRDLGDRLRKEEWLAEVGTRTATYREGLRDALSKAGQV